MANKDLTNRELGFTLLEIVVSMIILGIMVIIAGLGIVTGTKGYLFTRENAHMAQKAQLAMARMNRELTELMHVTSTTPSSIVYERPGGQYSIAKVGDVIKIREGSASLPDEDNGDILIDNVDSFTLICYKIMSGTTPVAWTPADDIELLYAIEVSMTLARSESGIGDVGFSTTVNPRNNKNYGGAPPTTNPPSKASYGCFVTTATYGNPNCLDFRRSRHFRDRLLQTPLFLIVSCFLIRLILAIPRCVHHAAPKMSSNQKGSVLIALIVTMVVLSSIGAAMVSLTSTSTFSRTGSNSAERAYFLAESGYRYAASRYLNASGETAKDNELLAMHNQQTYTLLNDDGQFELRVYPYYFKTTASASVTPAPTLDTTVPGGFPPGLTLSTGRLMIGSKFHDYVSATQSDSNVTFAFAAPISQPPAGTDVFSVATSNNTVQTVSKGGDINLDPNDYARAFPSRNGTIKVKDHIYAYEELDLANNRLTGIYDPAEPNMSPFTVDAGTNIILQKFAKLHSTGVFGQGSVQTKREIIFHVPLPTSSTGEKEEFHDTFEDKSHWEASTLGSHAIETIGGDKALKVTGTGDVVGAVGAKGSLITLDWKTTNVDLARARQSAGNFLSYDAQVKIGFDPLPPWTYDGLPFPEYYMAGISFRQKYNGDSYGLSFLRGDNEYDRGDITDGIPDELVPLNDSPMIVLWQQTNSDVMPQRKWLAYKELSGATVYFYDDVESGINGWSATGLWNITNRRANSPTNAWYYGQPATWNYDTGATNSGSIVSPDINLNSATSATLRFWSWYETEDELRLWDKKFVDISTNGGANWTTLYQISGDSRIWRRISINLSSYVGRTIKIRFRFDTIDGLYNNFEGWYVDDIQITADYPIHESTLLVRIKEAATLRFINGSGPAVIDGDTISGTDSHAKGRVCGTPILSAGSWGAGDARGIITLNNVTGTFTDDEVVRVLGSEATAKATGYNERDNYIMAYYGDIYGYGTPNYTPLDNEKHGNPRGELHWPPDEVDDTEPDNDYFTLVQWDANIDPSVERLGIGLRENAIIRTDAITTTDSPNFGQPEIGLHTFGYSSTNVYFDDFGLQAEVVTVITTPPIQE